MSDAVQATTAPSPAAAANGSLHTLCCLIAWYISAVIWGVRSVYHDQPSRIDLLLPFAVAVSLGTWAVIDARRRRSPIPLSAQMWFFLLAGVIVPGYIIWSRGWRGLGWIALHAVLWVVLLAISMLAGGVIVYGEAWLRAFKL